MGFTSDISLLAGLKNNLEYSKNFYYTTRALYPDVEIVFTSYNSNDGTNEWLDSLNDDNLIYFCSAEDKTFSDTYNKCTSLATRKYVAYTHNDIVLTPNFIENIEKHVNDNSIICYTTIEPPIFADDERPGKIVKDFGSDIESLNVPALYEYSLKIQAENKDGIIEGIGTTFFLCVNRETLLSIGGLDRLYNPMFCEDDDLILRLRLLGLKTLTSLDAICYHFVSKTSRFSEEYQERTKRIELNSNKNFVRKWGFRNSSSAKKKFDTGLILQHGDKETLAKLEPWFSIIYTDCNIADYIKDEQPNTAIDLSAKIKPLNAPKTNDILIKCNATKLNNKALKKLERINAIIADKINAPVNLFAKLLRINHLKFKYSIFHINIIRAVSHEDQLITNPTRSNVF